MNYSDGIAEIVLIVADVQKSAAFYRDIVRLKPQSEPSDEWAWFWTGTPDDSARLAVHRGPLLFEEHSPLPEGHRFGAIHYALRVPRERFEAAAEHVRSHDIPVYGPVRFDWMKAESVYFYDLDGHLIEWWSPDPV